MGWLWHKTVAEVKDYVAEMKDSWQRRSWIDRLQHIPIDVFTEAYRRMPYTLGHITFFALVLTQVFNVNIRQVLQFIFG
jgi:hypothetical protein